MLARKPVAKRLASDDEITIDDETMEKAIAYLKSRLKPEEISHIQMMFKGEPAEDTKEDREDEEDKPSEDSGPVPFKGMPKPGGSMASDSLGGSYGSRWPDAARIRQGW